MIDDDVAVQFMLLQTALACVCGLLHISKSRRRRRRWWVHPLNQRRVIQGDFHNLLSEMRDNDPKQFQHYMRLNPAQFDEIVNLVSPLMNKRSNRPSLPVALRLSLTLR